MGTIIKKMPTKEVLEDFVRSMHEHTCGAYFDLEKGMFVGGKKNNVKKK